MWPFDMFWGQKNIVSISLNPQYFTCCWLNNGDSGKKTGSKKIIINAYEKTEFKSLEFENAIIFNPTKISFVINNFIKKNKIKKPLITIAINGPSVFEKVITLSTSNPTEQDFELENIFNDIINRTGNLNTNNLNNKIFTNKNNIKFNYTYLCPAISEGLNIGFNFYICGISQAQLFQYKLLTLKTGGNLTLVTTELAALIELYKYTKDQNFSQSQLAIDLSKNSYNIKALFSPEIISKISILKNNLNINLAHESQDLATSLGLFLLGDKIWKK